MRPPTINVIDRNAAKRELSLDIMGIEPMTFHMHTGQFRDLATCEAKIIPLDQMPVGVCDMTRGNFSFNVIYNLKNKHE